MNNIDKGGIIQKKIFNIIGGKTQATILNDKLNLDLEKLKKIYKEPALMKAVDSVKSLQIILIKLPLDDNLPKLIPFFKYRKNGQDRVLVNLTSYINESKDPDTEAVSYSINNSRTLYTLVLSAYIYLKLIDDKTVLPPEAIKYSSVLWARLYCKILRSAGMIQDSDRRDAFMYFAMKFFMKYYLEAPDAVCDNIAINYLTSNKKIPLIVDMETEIENLDLHPYNSFVDFCSTMFNSRVTGLKGLRIKNVEDSINTTFFLTKFIENFHEQAYMSLCAYPFFVMVIIDGLNKGNICNDRYLEDIILYDNKETTKLLNSIYKEL